ncbi:MAG TPA: glycosyltransferase [Leucothrix sp.]|nr:glycosyltransferase [Leucothrix sp.]
MASEYNQNVFLLPNYLDPGLWNLRNKQLKPHLLHNGDSDSHKNKDTIKIGYVGTATHDGDLAIITEAMKRLEAEYGDNIQIEVIGAFQKRLDKPLFGQAIPLEKNRMYPQFVTWLRNRMDWDIAVIPLEDNHFNKSKSHLKYLECSAMGLACVCSDVSTYSSIVENNKNGLLVKNNSEDWYLAIKDLIENPAKREQLSLEAYDNLIKHHTTHINTKVYQKILQNINKLSAHQEIPELPYQSKSFLEKMLIKRYGRYNRLWSKLLNDPHYYFADSRHGWLRPLRYIFSK